MKTIAAFAKENNTSPTTIYRKLDKAVKQGVAQGLTEKQGNITYLTEKGEDFLYSCLTHVQQSFASVEQPLNADKRDNKSEIEEVLFLRKQNETLQEQLNIEREHSRSITDSLAKITENQQKLLGMEQSRQNPTLSIEDKETRHKKKHGFFGLFKRKQ